MKRILAINVLLIFFFNFSSTNQSPINKKTFSEITVKILLIRYTNLSINEKAQITKKIFETYKVSEKDYLKLMEQFQDKPNYWQDIYQRMNKILQTLKPDSIPKYILKNIVN